MTPFKVVIADPPWPFKDKLPGVSRGAAKNYSCNMSISDICRLPIPPLAPDCLLGLWRVAAMQQEALDVIKAWGFGAPSTEFVWLKKTATGKRWFGMGRIVRAEHEICLLATRGRPDILSHSERSTFVTDVTGLSAPYRGHSVKPDEFYSIIETLSEGPYLELFARKHRPGWVCQGLELEHPEVLTV